MTPAAPDFEARVADWLSVEEATSRVLAAVPTTPAKCERVPLSEALGRALAEDLRASATLPPWPNSAMDGYAVHGNDVTGASQERPVALRVVGLLRAGGAPAPRVEAGEAVRIMTGAPLPDGADSVVRREDTDEESEPGRVVIHTDRDAGRNVRPGGQDMRDGDLVLEAGATITPGVVAVLAALGRVEVPVRPRLSVAILTTGDELRPATRYDDVRAGAGIPDSNGPMLAAAVRAAGGRPVLLGSVPDDRYAVVGALEQAKDADVLVTVGGASMGEADLVKRALESAGFDLDFWRVRMRPGSPFSFGHLHREGRPEPVFGLPGNPASAFVTFELFVRPFLLRAGGHRRVARHAIACRAGEHLKGAEGLTLFTRVSIDASTSPPTVRTTGPQTSGLVSGLAHADGLAVIPEGHGAAQEGSMVDVILLGQSTAGPLTPRHDGVPSA
ncbi:MAG: molybdopterin molybdotransferase MoeA [Gemmatimonadetes bacterium]|nr:molybdopterin molybdotransferase MoeA [Gemmatimonadota bacterium]